MSQLGFEGGSLLNEGLVLENFNITLEGELRFIVVLNLLQQSLLNLVFKVLRESLFQLTFHLNKILKGAYVVENGDRVSFEESWLYIALFSIFKCLR